MRAQKQQRRGYNKGTTHTSYALYYHLTWSTEDREPLISKGVESMLSRFFPAKCRELDVILMAHGMVPDHVHLLISLKPTHSIPEVVRRLKGASSREVNRSTSAMLYWERGYSVRTVSERNLDVAKSYVNNQKVRHGIL
ncbi:MAG: IS200/IS605 family transposase [Chloroflexi bacterium]|nr:IS200/IS605 family transposase [Chloroflexota bacterium]